MQQLSPKDRPKLIGLIIGVVLVLGFGVKTTMDTMATVSGGTPRPAPSSSPVAAGAVATTAATTTAAAPEANTGTYIIKRGYTDNRGRDPFSRVSDSEFAKYSVKIPSLAPPPPPAPIVTGNTGVLGRNTFKAFREGINNLNARQKDLSSIDRELSGVGASVPVPPPVVKVLPPPPPPYTVVGVLIGEPGGRDVAILSRTTGSDKKFVVAGDDLEGGYKVTAIESGGVRVTHPGRRATTSTVPGANPVPVAGGTEYYLPKQTTVVPATSMTIPLGDTSKTSAPGVK
jgi:hypothetical protein